MYYGSRRTSSTISLLLLFTANPIAYLENLHNFNVVNVSPITRAGKNGCKLACFISWRHDPTLKFARRHLCITPTGNECLILCQAFFAALARATPNFVHQEKKILHVTDIQCLFLLPLTRPACDIVNSHISSSIWLFLDKCLHFGTLRTIIR
jgi:hypothetical protein